MREAFGVLVNYWLQKCVQFVKFIKLNTYVLQLKDF